MNIQVFDIEIFFSYLKVLLLSKSTWTPWVKDKNIKILKNVKKIDLGVPKSY